MFLISVKKHKLTFSGYIYNNFCYGNGCYLYTKHNNNNYTKKII